MFVQVDISMYGYVCLYIRTSAACMKVCMYVYECMSTSVCPCAWVSVRRSRDRVSRTLSGGCSCLAQIRFKSKGSIAWDLYLAIPRSGTFILSSDPLDRCVRLCVCVYTSTHTYENEHKRTDINRQTHTETHIHRHTNARSNSFMQKSLHKTLAYMNRKTLYRVDTTLAYICNSNKNNNKPVSSKLYVENGVLSN